MGDWPFRIVSSLEDLSALAEWLQALGAAVEKVPVGIAVRDSELAFTTKECGWIIPTTSASKAVSSMLTRILVAERTAPVLVSRDMTLDIHFLMEHWLEEYVSVRTLANNFVHDLRALEYATGRPVVKREDLSPIKDALDAAIVGPMMAVDAPRFYVQVGLPIVRHNLPHLLEATEGWRRWTLIYEHLLFRVLAHYTRDPTLLCWLQNGWDPLSEFGRVTDLDQKQALALLLWMCVGEDEALLAQHYPGQATNLPESPQLIKATKINKNLPTLRLGLIRLLDDFANRSLATTLYGRHSPLGLRPAERLHFTLLGSAADVIDVVVASLINVGSQHHWVHQDPWPPVRAIIVGYTDAEPVKWQQTLEQLGSLTHPLAPVELSPKVTVE